MKLWRSLRTELAGAWRSLRYDLGRRAPVPDSGAGAEGPDVTCTGMSTFGVPIPADDRPLRRPLLVVSLFLLLAAVGAAASYLAVVGGLGALLRDGPAPPRPYPIAAAPPETGSMSSTDLGRSGGHAAAPGTEPAGTRTAVPAADPAPQPTEKAPAETASPAPARPEIGTPPPVPTPTAPSADPHPSAGPSPSPAPSPSDSPSATPSSSPDDTPSASPSTGGDGAGATGEALVRHRRRHGY